MTVVFIVAASLILFSAFFSASSTSVFSVGGSRIRTLLEEGFKGAEELSELRSRAGTIQGLLFSLASFSSLLAVGLLSGWCAMEWGISGLLAGILGSGVLVILLGELLPRTFAASRSVQVALAVAPTVILLEKAFNPLLSPFLRLESYLARSGGERDHAGGEGSPRNHRPWSARGGSGHRGARSRGTRFSPR